MMKFLKIITLYIYATFCTQFSNAETKLSKMQGIWGYTLNDEENKAYKIVKGNTCLEFAFSNSSNNLDFSLFEMIIGFQNSIESNEKIYTLNVDSLNDSGLYYTEIISKKYIKHNKTVLKPNFIIPSYYECDGEILSINGGKLFEYEKIPKLPNKVLEKLYYRGKNDNRNYIKEYLNIKVAEIIAPKSTVYLDLNNPTTYQLSKGEIVTVIEEKENWIKVDYWDGVSGWLKKEDVICLEAN